MKNNNIKKFKFLTGLLVVSLMLLAGGFIQAASFTPLTAQIGLGATGSNVNNLQTFLASNPNIYPQGLVTGYFGTLTQTAVMRFQAAYGISQVGRVGPQTLAEINSLIASGTVPVYGGNTATTSSASSPTIYTPSVSPANTSAIISWSTDKPTTQEVYYNSAPFQLAEAQVGVSEPTIVGGAVTTESTTYSASQSVTLQNLQPNTLYYYIIETTDSAGNVSVTWPTTFMTHQ